MEQPGFSGCGNVSGAGLAVLGGEGGVGSLINVRHVGERLRWVPLETAGEAIGPGFPNGEFLAGVGPQGLRSPRGESNS
jgi:hypothetical protein